MKNTTCVFQVHVSHLHLKNSHKRHSISDAMKDNTVKKVTNLTLIYSMYPTKETSVQKKSLG